MSLFATMQRLWREYSEKLVRYAGVSVVNVFVGQTLLILGKSGFGWSSVAANAFAVTLGTTPSYVLSRYWVWGKDGPNRLWSEVVPFWVMAFLGLGLSTLLVRWADDIWGGQIAANAANITAFGGLWLIKFFVLDRVLFSSLAERGA